jgi:hypothetical protein
MLSLWEEVEVKRKIDVLVSLGKMKPSSLKNACRVTFLVKKDASRQFCGAYRPLNLQTKKYALLMLLVDDILTHLGKS